MSMFAGMTRRDLLARAGAGVLGVALSGTVGACASSLPSAGQPAPTGGPASGVGTQMPVLGSSTRAQATTLAGTGPAAVPTSTTTPRRGGTLRYGTIGDYLGLEPERTSTQLADTLWSVWDRLTAYDANLQLQPMLAESWEISDDQQQFKFNLRRGVQFHTGRDLTADDVKWSLKRLQDPGSTQTGRAEVMSAVETPDKYTVIVRASRPWVEAFDFFEQANIIDPITFQAVGASRPIGTGPFMFAEYAQGDHLRLVKNTHYWRNDRPYLDEVLVSIRADAQAAVAELEARALDVVGYGLPVSAALRLQKDPAYQVLVNGSTGTCWMLFANCTQAPTDNKLIRQALNYALDRKRIADSVWHGLAKPEALPWPPTSPAYDAIKVDAFGFDLDKARSLLAQSGVSNVHVDLGWSTTTQDFATLAQIYQADLAKIGVDVALKPLEPPVFAAARSRVSYQGLLLAAPSFGYVWPGSVMLAGAYAPDINGAVGGTGFKDNAYAQLSKDVLSETNPAKQGLLYARLNDYYLDQSWVIPVVQSPERHVVRAGVRGLRYDAHQALVLSEVWLV